MARFTIDSTRQVPEAERSIFGVTWLSGTLSAGQSFPVYQAGHIFQVNILTVTQAESGAKFLYDYEFGWDMQYAQAILTQSLRLRRRDFAIFAKHESSPMPCWNFW